MPPLGDYPVEDASSAEIRALLDSFTDAKFIEFVAGYFEAEFDEGNYITERLRSIAGVTAAIFEDTPEKIVAAVPEPRRWRTEPLAARITIRERLAASGLQVVPDISEGTG